MAKKKQNQTPQKATDSPSSPPPATDKVKTGQPVRTAPDGSPIVTGGSVQSILFNNDAHKAAQLITLAAFYSPISQLTLSPVYGTAQASLYHRWGSLATALAAFLCVSFLQTYIPKRMTTVIPVFAFWIPILQFFLFKCSSLLPMPYGPLITEILTYYPLLFFSVYAAGLFFSKVDLSAFNQTIAEQLPSASAYLLFTGVSRIVRDLLPIYMGSNIVFSRVGLQIVVAGLYGLALPTATLWPALPALGFTMLANVHNPLQRTTDVLNNTLALHNYTLLERRESVTGYISVLENTNDQFRVMRCDHSLLGGEWTMPPPKGRVPRVKEPIFAIFAMLEAVRLVEPAAGVPRLLDTQKRALNIGLGVGTAPTAMIAHGINTTILELDPVVHEFALKYFGLPTNHTFVIGDALQIVQQMIPNVNARYDIVIHDVFTGGAEPVDLFTLEFLSNVAALLKPDGVIAINYAGDLALPAASHVVRTILAVFPSCRIFREDDPLDPLISKPASPSSSSSSSSSSATGPDFTNVVIFCKRTPNAAITFRKPVEADFLGSGARRAFLLPQHELAVTKENFELDGEVLRVGKTKQLEAWHRKSAIGHWKVMRTVMPSAVWENW